MITLNTKPVQPNENNVQSSLRGVVTLFNQSYNKKDEDGLVLKRILKDENLMNQFSKYTFPGFEETSDGKLFILPAKHVSTTTNHYYIKWLILDKGFKPVHNHDYPMVPLPEEGYIMRIEIKQFKEDGADYDITYLMDVNHVHFERSEELIKPLNPSLNNTIDTSTESLLCIEPFSMDQRHNVYDLIINQKTFYEKYLSHVLTY